MKVCFKNFKMMCYKTLRSVVDTAEDKGGIVMIKTNKAAVIAFFLILTVLFVLYLCGFTSTDMR
jgi:hypothetical protein